MKTIILLILLSLSQVACAHGYNRYHSVYPSHYGHYGHHNQPMQIYTRPIIIPQALSRSQQRDLKYAIDNRLFERQMQYRLDAYRR